MTQLTETNFYNKWNPEFTDRGDAGITGTMMGEFMEDIKDSCTFKSSGSGGGSGSTDSYYSSVLTVDDLDGNNAIEVEHNLNSSVPLVAVWNNNGELLTGLNYSLQVIDADTVELTFEDPPDAGETYKFLIWVKLSDISENLDFIESLYIDFQNGSATQEGSGYAIHPPGWTSYTKLGNGTVEDHLSADTNHNFDNDQYGIRVVNEDTGTQYLLLLENDTRYVEDGETYRIQMFGSYLSTTCNMVICGQTIQINSGTGFNVDVNITVSGTQKFYIQTDSDEDLNFYIQNLTVTKL